MVKGTEGNYEKRDKRTEQSRKERKEAVTKIGMKRGEGRTVKGKEKMMENELKKLERSRKKPIRKKGSSIK